MSGFGQEGTGSFGADGTAATIMDPGGIVRGKTGRDPRVAPGFEGLLEALGPLLQGITDTGGADSILGGQLAGQQSGIVGSTGQSLQDSGTFDNALGNLNRAMGEGFGAGITGDLLSQFQNLQRPGLDLQKQFLEADVFEGAARSGTTRSTGTTEALSRGFGQIEAGGSQAAGQFASAVAPSAIGAQLGAITQGLGLPSQVANMFSGPLAQQLQSQQFQQGLQGQAFGDILSGIPIQEGRLPGKQGGSGGAVGGIASMFCWVAREVYGEDDERWLQVRDIVLTDTPPDFQLFYMANGPGIAKHLSTHPKAKARMRVLMDELLEVAA